MKHERIPRAGTRALLKKRDPNLPAFVVTGPRGIAVRAGVEIAGVLYRRDTPIEIADVLEPGGDYTIMLGDFVPRAGVARAGDIPLGGFHFAPGGNAKARSGGDTTPAINPFSVYDQIFRPACPDPRGMTLVANRFWCDIYLCGVDHPDAGTSVFGATIADGVDRPQKPGGGRFERFDFAAARAVMAHHGKALLSAAEFFDAARGVTEKTATGSEPRKTGLDAPRTSRWGVMQATGNMWTWGHDGDPDEPRASLFGGSWLHGSHAGSRDALLDYWPGDSGGGLGARGRSDHLILV